MAAALIELEAEVRALVDLVRDDPQGRLRLRQAFYRRYGEVEGWPEGFGISELDFLQWEIRRGVLDPATGSPWWRDVNLDFLYASELAGRIHIARMDPPDLPEPVRFWFEYFRKPSEVTWYRAHNGSILNGYLKYPDLAARETTAEQTFLNMVLYRLLFAQSLTEERHPIIAELAHLIASPLSPAVDILVHIPDFYPDHYPLSDAEAKNLLHLSLTPEGLSVAVLDDIMILPHLMHLYQAASRWLRQPTLEFLVRDGRPVYPIIRAAGA